MSTPTERLGPLGPAVEATITRLAADAATERILARDHTFWQDDPDEVENRLGWLVAPAEMLDRAGEISSFAVGLAGNGVRHVLLMGMGGSSLFPEVAAGAFGDGEAALDLRVLDTTDPGAIARLGHEIDLDATFFLAASKSGTTVETRSQLAYFWEQVGAPERFGVITDPGSPLATLARDRGLHAVFENRSDLGGRYSALSHFGLVPAALAGADIEELLHRALDMADACRAPEAENPGIRLGAVMATAAQHGRDKLTLMVGDHLGGFGAWIEQLVAESTGKRGVGIVPVDGEAVREAADYGPDRCFALLGVPELGALAGELAAAGHPVVDIPSDDPYDLGAEVYRFEFATAVAGRVLGVNPFDQPDVEAAKLASRQALEAGRPEVALTDLDAHLAGAGPGDYLAVQAFVDPGSDQAVALAEATSALGERLGIAATFGLGPRFLHSTGQLHKGGPPTGVFVQVVGDDPQDLEVPGAGYTFSELKHAQAAGDLAALREQGRRAARVPIEQVLAVIE